METMNAPIIDQDTESMIGLSGADTLESIRTARKNMEEFFGAPISIYTREQGIEDGILFEASNPENDTAEVCAQHLPGHSVCFTEGLFALVTKAVENKKHSNDYKGVTHDILWMSRFARWDSNGPIRTKYFKVIITGAGRTRLHILKMVLALGGNRPEITVMLRNED